MEQPRHTWQAGWYPDPHDPRHLRFWDPDRGWSHSTVPGSGGQADATGRPEPSRMRLSVGGAVVVGTVMLAIGLLVGLALGSADWGTFPLGRPLPPAPVLPAGSDVVQGIEGSDGDDGWIGIRGAAFRSGMRDADLAEFLRGQYPSAQGWEDVAGGTGQKREDGLVYRCRARLLPASGDWESVLLISGPTEGRFIVMRSEVGGDHWPLTGGEPTMDGCADATFWAGPFTVFSWLSGP